MIQKLALISFVNIHTWLKRLKLNHIQRSIRVIKKHVFRKISGMLISSNVVGLTGKNFLL